VKIALAYPFWRIADPLAPPFDAMSILGQEIARRLARSDEVVVYSRRLRGQPAHEVRDAVVQRRFSVGLDRALSALKLFDRLGVLDRARPFRSSALYYPLFALKLALELRRGGCDVAHVFGIPVFVPILRALNPGLRIVLHMHDHSLVQRDRARTARQLAGADRIVGCSEYVSSRIAARFPALASRCRTLPNGVDLDRFDAPERREDSARLLYVGRLSPEKGVHVLLEAFGEVAYKHPEAELELVGPRTLAPAEFVDPLGEDPLLDEIGPHLADRAGWSRHLDDLAQRAVGRVRFAGAMDQGKLSQRLRRADVFVFPSLWPEPFGMPVIEAMAARRPVVATRGGALPELVEDGATGLLVPRGDAAGLAYALERLLSDAELRRDMGHRGRARAEERFGWDAIVADLRRIYVEALA
jgi:glycosyltransferase involved in cell wall biosynthesis